MTPEKIEEKRKEFGYYGKPIQWQQGFDVVIRHWDDMMKIEVNKEKQNGKVYPLLQEDPYL